MAKTTKRGSKAKARSKYALKDLPASGGQAVKVKGERSDIGQKLQFQLNEANSIYNR
jgi:hypothetical protein